VTPAIGDKINGGLISTSRILNGLVNVGLLGPPTNTDNTDSGNVRADLGCQSSPWLWFLRLLVVVLLRGFCSRRLFELQQRLDARAIRIGDFDERFVTQGLQVILALLLLSLTQHRFPNAI